MRMYVLAAIGIACLAGAARAQSVQAGQSVSDSVTIGCHERAIEALRGSRPHTVRIRLGRTPLQRASTDNGARVYNEGYYSESRDGPWHRFTYDCQFFERTARAKATVSFEGADALRGGGAPRVGAPGVGAPRGG
jgi:hypothetical protein